MLSNKLATKVAFTEPDIEQYKASTRQFKPIRRRSLDSMLLKVQGMAPVPEWTASTFVTPRLVGSRLKALGEAFPKERSNMDYQLTNRGSPSTSQQPQSSGPTNEE